MDRRLLAAVGIDPDLPAAQAAALLVRSLPLRFRPRSDARDPDTVVESRWFAGPAECARVLGRLFRGATVRGAAFGSVWPYLEAAGLVVSPALPVAAEVDEQQGPDGAYQLADGRVWREAVGHRRAFLSAGGAAEDADDKGAELLWFGGSERYLVRAGTLEVEDLFSKLTVPASRALVERMVVRGLRSDRQVLEGVGLTDRQAPAEIEVRRPTGLVSGDIWRDPAAVLGRRVDIQRVERRGDEIVAETARDTTTVFRIAEEPRGWRLFLWDGVYPLRMLALLERGGHLAFAATLAPELDPLAPGVRGRLAFDLRSDLVALGKGTSRGRGVEESASEGGTGSA
jgi:hypothetical protein